MRDVPDLPPLLRFAVGYAPRQTRALFASLFAFDRQMAGIVARHSEPLVAQLKLAWWRDRLTETGNVPGDNPGGSIVTAWTGGLTELSPMVDGWEEMLAQSPDFLAVATGRAAPFGALASIAGCDAVMVEEARIAAQRWALIDLHDHLSQPAERHNVRVLAAQLAAPRSRLPRALRPLAVLDGLARRSLARGGEALLGDRFSPLAALRLGIFGR